MPDGPGTAIEKLYAFRTDHFLMGKEYDEAALRRTLGLPAVPNPEFLAETPDRKRLVRMDDREAKRELDAAQAEQAAMQAKERHEKLVAETQGQRIADLEAEIARMKAEANGNPAPPATPPAEPKPTESNPAQGTGEGEPNTDWSPKQIVDFMEANGLPLPPKKGFGMTKVALLEFYLEQKGAAEAEAPKN